MTSGSPLSKLLPLDTCPICGQRELTVLRPVTTIVWGQQTTESRRIFVTHSRPVLGLAGYLRRLWPWSPDPICEGSGREVR